MWTMGAASTFLLVCIPIDRLSWIPLENWSGENQNPNCREIIVPYKCKNKQSYRCFAKTLQKRYKDGKRGKTLTEVEKCTKLRVEKEDILDIVDIFSPYGKEKQMP